MSCFLYICSKKSQTKANNFAQYYISQYWLIRFSSLPQYIVFSVQSQRLVVRLFGSGCHSTRIC